MSQRAVRFANRFAPGAPERARRRSRACAATARGGQRVRRPVERAVGGRLRQRHAITCCRRAAVRARAAGFRPGISCAAPACSSLLAAGIAAAGAGGFRAGGCRRAWWRTGAPSRCASEARPSGRNARRSASRAWRSRAASVGRASGALRRAGRGPRREAAPRFQREHRRAARRRCCARCAGLRREQLAHLSGVRSLRAAAGAALWRAARGDAAHQWRGRRACAC